MNAVNVGLVTFIIQHNRIQGVFLLCKITNLLIYSIKIKCVVRIQITTLIISKKPGNTGISRDIRTEFTTDLLLSD